MASCPLVDTKLVQQQQPKVDDDSCKREVERKKRPVIMSPQGRKEEVTRNVMVLVSPALAWLGWCHCQKMRFLPLSPLLLFLLAQHKRKDIRDIITMSSRVYVQ